MAERWIINAGRPLVLPLVPVKGTVQVVEHQTPVPAPRTQFAQRPEGSLPTSREVDNRTITIKVAMVDARDAWSASNHDFGTPPTEAAGEGDLPGWYDAIRRAPGGSTANAAISDLLAAAGALRPTAGPAVTGTITRVLASGERVTFDVVDATSDGPAWDLTYYLGRLATVTLTLTCLPFGRSPERLLGSGTLAAGQRLLSISGLTVPGDVPALARLEYSASASAQRSLLYAIDQPDAPTLAAGLQRSATALTTASTMATATLTGSIATQVRLAPADGGATPPGTWVPNVWLRDLSGVPLPVSGTVKVMARVWATGATTLRLRWATGAGGTGFAASRQVTVQQGWSLVTLGVVGATQVLDGVIERLMSVTVACSYDVVLVVPAQRSGIAYSSTVAPPEQQAEADTLGGTGALSPSSTPSGSVWATIGAATGSAWTRTTGKATRATVPGWTAVGLPASTALARVGLDVGSGAQSQLKIVGPAIGNAAGIAALGSGVGAAGAWAVALMLGAPDEERFAYLYVVTDTTVTTTVGNAYLPNDGGHLDLSYDGSAATGTWTTPYGGTETLRRDVPVAAPGTLRWAIVGNGSAMHPTSASGFVVGLPVWAADRALLPTKTSEIRTDGTARTTAAGLTGPLAAYEGERPTLPPSGREGRLTRVTMGTSRTDLRTGEDATLAPFTGRVYATPRYLQIPDGGA